MKKLNLFVSSTLVVLTFSTFQKTGGMEDISKSPSAPGHSAQVKSHSLDVLKLDESININIERITEYQTSFQRGLDTLYSIDPDKKYASTYYLHKNDNFIKYEQNRERMNIVKEEMAKYQELTGKPHPRWDDFKSLIRQG